MFDKIGTYKFANPEFLWAIPIVIVIGVLWYFLSRNKQYSRITISSIKAFENEKSVQADFLKYLPLLRILGLVLLLVALARPQTFDSDEKVNTFGIDIVLSMDVSASMLAQDFKPNRLEAAKKVASEFVTGRENDRFGLVVFSGESFTQVPVTTDHLIVQEQLRKIQYGFLSQGTAIGMGIATGVNRLKNSTSKSKVIILMTDGVNNAGTIDPKLALEAANQYDIKIYTIGVGSKGKAMMPVGVDANGKFQYGLADGEIDEPLLKEIAKETGGIYFRATDNSSLKAIYEKIDLLEKTEIETSQTVRSTEEFYPFALFAAALLLLEAILRYIILKTIL